MKIIMTVHTYAPNLDGVQFVTKYLAEGLVKRGHKVTLITYKYPNRCEIDEEDINGVHVIRWNVKTKYTFHKGDKSSYQSYILNNQDNYDFMINVGTQTALTDWLFPIIDKVKIPKMLYIHSIWDFKIHKEDLASVKSFIAKNWASLRWGIYYMRYRNVIRQYNIVSQLHKEDYSNKFFERFYKIKSVIIENAADNEFFNDNLGETLIRKPYIINVANYNDRKNQKLALRAFCESDVSNDWSMVFIGSEKNAYYNELIELYSKLKTNKNVYFLTNVSRKSIYTYVKNADLYFMTSKWEAFPISLIEAMAAGIPFLSSNVGIVKYLPGGLVYNNTLPEDLETLINDEELRLKLSKEGRSYALQHYRIEQKVKQLENLLVKSLEERKR